MRQLMVVAVAVTLAGCAALKSGSGVAANPIVTGVINIASEAQCAAYAADHPEDAATLKAYLSALSSAANGCATGLSVTPTPAAGPTVVR